MESLRQILSPDFLLCNSVYTSVLIGFACPLVGVFLVLRRLVFMGVALPQISSTGVAVALSIPFWLGAARGAHHVWAGFTSSAGPPPADACSCGAASAPPRRRTYWVTGNPEMQGSVRPRIP